MNWFRNRTLKSAAADWHRLILKLARTPQVYVSGWVRDDFDGRFQMVTLVSTLVLRRVRAVDQGARLADLIYREVFSGLDHAFREEGVGDATIARKMRGLGEEFFGLAKALDADFSADDVPAAVTATLTRNAVAAPDHCSALAAWVIDLEYRLQVIDDVQIRRAELPESTFQA
ncbi:MAG: ubiquinol-cytochrome C chaperone family protein [Henriciella sp.]|nr:ubiquinol-cytochrome C chaperone family protein [Henriciella sp.]